MKIEVTPKKLDVIGHFHVFDQPLSLAWQVLLISATSAGLFTDLSWWILGLNLEEFLTSFFLKFHSSCIFQSWNMLLLFLHNQNVQAGHFSAPPWLWWLTLGIPCYQDCSSPMPPKTCLFPFILCYC